MKVLIIKPPVLSGPKRSWVPSIACRSFAASDPGCYLSAKHTADLRARARTISESLDSFPTPVADGNCQGLGRSSTHSTHSTLSPKDFSRSSRWSHISARYTMYISLTGSSILTQRGCRVQEFEKRAKGFQHCSHLMPHTSRGKPSSLTFGPAGRTKGDLELLGMSYFASRASGWWDGSCQHKQAASRHRTSDGAAAL